MKFVPGNLYCTQYFQIGIIVATQSDDVIDYLNRYFIIEVDGSDRKFVGWLSRIWLDQFASVVE